NASSVCATADRPIPRPSPAGVTAAARRTPSAPGPGGRAVAHPAAQCTDARMTVVQFRSKFRSPRHPDGGGVVQDGAMPASSGDPPGALAISEVARLTGLSTATLRVWQRRYGLGASRSSPGGHRRYSPQDVARLRAVQRLVGQGLPTAEAVRVVLSPVEHGLDLPAEAHAVAHLLAAAALD